MARMPSMRLAVVMLAVAACAGPQPSAEPAPDRAATPSSAGKASASPNLEALAQRIRARIEGESSEHEVAVVLIDLASGERLGIGEEVSMHAASTMKVPVLLELFRQAEAGRFSLEDTVLVENEFRSIADGSRYTLGPESDSEHALYDLVGEGTTLRDLARRMIVRSSNLATNNLIDIVSPDSVRRLMEELGSEQMRVLRGVEDIPAYEAGMNNATTAAALARVLEAAARCELLSRDACEEVIGILAAQEFDEMIPAGIPEGTRVAHKTGWITEIRHDGAIVYPPGRAPYVLAVLTRGFEDPDSAARLTADISESVWRALTGGEPGEPDAARDSVSGPDALPRPSGPEAGRRIDSVSDRLASLHDRHRVAAIDRRDFTPAAFWTAVGPVVDASPALVREVIGRSVEGRPLSSVRFGEGSTRVLLWSQMHGDESTATMALADIFRFVSASPEDPVAGRIREALTVVAIPVLNPDGARRFRRRNAQGIDVNRDARALATPEGRALERARERIEPRFGFNLHDQNVRTRVGESSRRAAIALLDPAFNEERDYDPVRRRARRVAAVVRRAVEPLVGDHITRYDDTFNPRAFGDLMQRRGVSTVLIESGGRRDDPEKQYLRKTNFVGILTALHAIATGTYRDADPAWYEDLPPNGRRLNDLLILGGEIAVPGREPYRADVAVDYDEPLRREGARIADIGDLGGYEAPDTLDASGLFVHPGPDLLERMLDEGRAELQPGVSAELVLRRGPGLSSEAVRTVTGGS